LVNLQIKQGVFIEIMMKKSLPPNDGSEDTEEEGQAEETDAFFTLFVAMIEHDQCGQQLSKIFLTDREWMSDANKANCFKRLLLHKCEDELSKQDIYVDWKKEKAKHEEKKSTMTFSERGEMEISVASKSRNKRWEISNILVNCTRRVV
jgi:hypothetical protein